MPDRSAGYRLYPRAEADLEEIWRYTARTWSLAQADRYHAALVEGFDALSAGTAIGRPVDIRDGYLRHPVGAHAIYYRLSGPLIDVVRILHQRMDVGRNLP